MRKEKTQFEVNSVSKNLYKYSDVTISIILFA